MVLIYSPDGTTYVIQEVGFEGIGSV